MGDEEVPAVGRKRRWCSREYGEKMVFECTDGSFRCVASMDMRGNELELALVGGDGPLECEACFIVHDVNGGRSPDGLEAGKHVVVCRDTMTVVFGGKGSNKDGIGGGVEAYHDVLVATLRAWVESASIVREEVREWKFVKFKR